MDQIEGTCPICGIDTALCLCGAGLGYGSNLREEIGLATNNEAGAQGLSQDLHAFAFAPCSAAQGLPQDFGTGCPHAISTTMSLFMSARSQPSSLAFPSLDEHSASMCNGCAQRAPLSGCACTPSFDNDDEMYAAEQGGAHFLSS
jgi:hypothetical protein